MHKITMLKKTSSSVQLRYLCPSCLWFELGIRRFIGYPMNRSPMLKLVIIDLSFIIRSSSIFGHYILKYIFFLSYCPQKLHLTTFNILYHQTSVLMQSNRILIVPDYILLLIFSNVKSGKLDSQKQNTQHNMPQSKYYYC